MGEFQQHPDGLVYVRDAGTTYTDTSVNFAADFGVTLPPLPEGAIERIYAQEKRHTLVGGEGFVLQDSDVPRQWLVGDQIISSLNAGLAAQAARQPPPPEPLPPDPPPGAEVLYDHENRLRLLEGQSPLNRMEFDKRLNPRGKTGS